MKPEAQTAVLPYVSPNTGLYRERAAQSLLVCSVWKDKRRSRTFQDSDTAVEMPDEVT